MDNIILAFSVVFPLMFMMAVGYSLRIIKITDEHSLNVMNKLVFRVFLPVLLFLNIYSLEPGEAFIIENVRLLIFTALIVLTSAFLMHLIFPHLVKDKRKCSVMIQGIFRSNLILFGIPIAASIYGEDRIGKVSMLAAFIVPLFNILSVIILEYYRSGVVEHRKIIINLIKNPLIIASLAAFLFLLLPIRLPRLLLSPLESMSKVATPLAFIVLGGTFKFKRIYTNLSYLFAAVLGRLIFFPGIIFSLALLSGFREEALVALIGAAASPTAVSSFSMAMEMDADEELAGQIVVFTSILSIATIFLWVLLLITMKVI